MSDQIARHDEAVTRIIGMLRRAATETCNPDNQLHDNALHLAIAELERLHTSNQILRSLLDHADERATRRTPRNDK